MLKKVRKGDLIICAELSRLGRNLFMIMEILNICMVKECRVWTIKDGYRLGDDIQSKVLAFAFGLSAEIERNLISQRTKEALARKRAEGQKLGRHVGSRNSTHKLDGKEQMLERMLRQGYTKVQIAKKLRVNRTTIYRYLKDTCSADTGHKTDHPMPLYTQTPPQTAPTLCRELAQGRSNFAETTMCKALEYASENNCRIDIVSDDCCRDGIDGRSYHIEFQNNNN